MLKRFRSDRSGNFAVISALLMLPLILAIGFAIDGSRYYSARTHLQDAADTAALAIAASKEQDAAKLRAEAEVFISGNVSLKTVQNVTIGDFASDAEKIDLEMNGSVPMTFMRLANYDTMPVSAAVRAMRAPDREVEIALVLDNTFSMSEVDAAGVSRLTTLQQAATQLVDALLKDEDGPFKIALVPYADYVNVGPQYRSASWISVPADKINPGKTCTIKTQTSCKRWGTKTPYSCPYVTDGVERPKTCYTYENCLEYETKDVCTGGSKETTETFFGCVRSRTGGSNHLTDGDLTAKYPGSIATVQKCPDAIVPLTSDKEIVSAAIDAMRFSRPSYEPLTYIPSGLMWGQNVLSPAEPFTEAGEYDPENKAPQKVMILMTDGDNTLARNNDGTHTKPKDAVLETKISETNADTLALCSYSKSKGIEIYTVAFMVENNIAKKLLENCATSKSHYFDASDSASLLSAFSGISRSLSQVRLAF